MDQVRHAAREQLGLLRMMVRRRELFVPMLGIWVASFGGALHAPVTTYFQMEVGATTAQIGNFGAIKTAGVFLMSPVYGWLLDTRSAYLPSVLSAFCCTFGCLAQGFAQDTTWLYAANILLAFGAANFWNTVGAYVAIATPRDMRSVVVSGYNVQVAGLRFLGTSLYPSWDRVLVLLGVESLLLRYHIHMSLCSFFCVFAFVYLVFCFEPAPSLGEQATAKDSHKFDQAISVTQLVLLLSTLVVQAFGESVVTVLWPMHIRKLGWDSHEYAYLQITSQLLVIAGTVQYPRMVQMLGHRATASTLPIVASFACAVAFQQTEPNPYAQALHIMHALLFLSVCGATKVCFQHLTTLAVPATWQGTIFSVLNMLASLGTIAGNLFGTRFADHETTFGGKGATPFLLASFLFGVVGLAVLLALVVPLTDSHGEGGAELVAADKLRESSSPQTETVGASQG